MLNFKAFAYIRLQFLKDKEQGSEKNKYEWIKKQRGKEVEKEGERG